jgi:putative membrane protein
MMWGSGMWVWGLLWMVLFWGLLVAGVVWLVRSAADRPERGEDGGARLILDERFALGEISADEYSDRRRTLEGRR